jgi:AcrR family transcriptional regulator
MSAVPRRYDSTRRRTASEQTRRDIVRAALRLHWEGVTNFDAMALEAGCSVSTVRKHYPTKEHLFRDCTRAFGQTLEMPDPAAIAGVEDAEARTEHAIRELFRVHEAMLGYAWHAARQRFDSPTLEALMTSYEQLAEAIAEIVASPDPRKAGLMRGLLDFLSYRALRLSGGLSPEQAVAAINGIACMELRLRASESRGERR